MTTLTIAENRVDDLQVGLTACLQALTRLDHVAEELRILREAVDQVAESIYNATIYDPAGDQD